MKKVVVICDRCNKQYFNTIPRTCRVCGEILYDRMPARYRALVLEKIEFVKHPYFRLLAASYILFGALLIDAAILQMQGFEPQVRVALYVVGAFYALAAPFFLPDTVSGHSIVQMFFFFAIMLAFQAARGRCDISWPLCSNDNFLAFSLMVIFVMTTVGFINNVVFKSAQMYFSKPRLSSHPAAKLGRFKKGKRIIKIFTKRAMHLQIMKKLAAAPLARPLSPPLAAQKQARSE